MPFNVDIAGSSVELLEDFFLKDPQVPIFPAPSLTSRQICPFLSLPWTWGTFLLEVLPLAST